MGNGECKYKWCDKKPLEGSEWCIFHKPDKTKEEIRAFRDGIKEKIDKKDYNFRGFVFPEVVDFLKDFGVRVFEKIVVFAGAEFKKKSTSQEQNSKDGLTLGE